MGILVLFPEDILSRDDFCTVLAIFFGHQQGYIVLSSSVGHRQGDLTRRCQMCCVHPRDGHQHREQQQSMPVKVGIGEEW